LIKNKSTVWYSWFVVANVSKRKKRAGLKLTVSRFGTSLNGTSQIIRTKM